MDHRQIPCEGELPRMSEEYKIGWPPSGMHRHPSTLAEPLFALGCTFVFLVLLALAAVGVLTVMRWLL